MNTVGGGLRDPYLYDLPKTTASSDFRDTRTKLENEDESVKRDYGD